MEISNKDLTCPFCNGKFKPIEMLFYADPAETSFFSPVDAGGEFQTMDANIRRNGRAGQAIPARGGRRDGLFGFDDNRTRTLEEEQPSEPEQEPGFPLGVQINDSVASEFLKKYGDGEAFNFKRTAMFYGIKPEDELSEKDTGYGYVSGYEGNDRDKKIPRELYVPSRGENPRLNQRICPKCHCDIPDDYFISEDENKHRVALVGYTSAGKTQYIVVALRELLDQFERKLQLGSVNVTECSRWFFDMYKDQYVKGQLAATKMKKLFPFIIRVESKSKGKIYFIQFEDCAGEYAGDGVAQKQYALNLDSIREARTLLLMIDCAQFFQNDVHTRESELKCEAPYGQALKPIIKNHLYENKDHCVAVVTKCDGIFDSPLYIHGRTNEQVNDGMEMVSTTMEAHKETVDTGLIDRVENELVTMLTARGQGNVKKDIEDSLDGTKVKMLAVSTYCMQNEAGKPKLVYDPEKKSGHFRVIEPLLYLMVEWGIINGEEKPIPGPVIEETPKPRGLFGKLFGRR